MTLPHRALVSHLWPPDAHSFSSDEYQHEGIVWKADHNPGSYLFNYHRQETELPHGGASALIAYLRSVCRFPGNPVDKHTCSSQACSHTHPDHRTLLGSPNIHPHLGQRDRAERLFYFFINLLLYGNEQLNTLLTLSVQCTFKALHPAAFYLKLVERSLLQTYKKKFSLILYSALMLTLISPIKKRNNY